MEDTYVEFDRSTSDKEQDLEDSYSVHNNSCSQNETLNTSCENVNTEYPVARPRSKTRTKSYELALEDSVDDVANNIENDYLPMTGSTKRENKESPSKDRPVPAPRPKDLSKKLAYARERVIPPENSPQTRPKIVPTRKAPSPPAKPPPEVVQKYFPPKDNAEVVKEKVTVIQEQAPSTEDKSKKRSVTKVKDRPRSSTWYDLNENDDKQGECSSSDGESKKINYVEISEQDRPRPKSAYLESSIKLPTRKKKSGIFDTIRSWTGGGGSAKKSSSRNSSFSLESSSKFYSDPEFVKSSGSSPAKFTEPEPSPIKPPLTLDLPVPSPRISIHGASDESPMSPTPPVPPPRLSKKSTRSYESENSFEDNVFLHMPTSISSDTGLDILARSSHVFESNSDTIPEDVITEEKENSSATFKIDPLDLSSHNARVPMLHPLEESRLKTITERTLHEPVHETTQHHEDEFDSLDVFIPPIEHQRVSPHKNPVLPSPLIIPKRLSKKNKKLSSFDELDMVVHEDGAYSEDEDYSGYIDPDQIVTEDLPEVVRKISDDVTPPALPPRDKSDFKLRPAVQPPSSDSGDRPRYTNTAAAENSRDLDIVVKAPVRAPSEHHYSVIVDDETQDPDYVTLREPDVPGNQPKVQVRQPEIPIPPPRKLSKPNSNCVDNAIVKRVNDLNVNLDHEVPALPATPPPREPPVHWSGSDLENSPKRTIDVPPVPNQTAKSFRTKKPLPASPTENDNNDLDTVIETSDFDLSNARENEPVSNTNDFSTDYDIPIPITNPDLDNSLSSDSESSEGDSDETTSSSDSSDETEQINEENRGCFSGESTPVVESKSMLDSLIGDRASVATLTPNASENNSLDYLESSSTTDSDDSFEKIKLQQYSIEELMSEPVRLRRQQAVSRDSGSLQSYTSSEGSSRTASWASFSSADYPTLTSYNNGVVVAAGRDSSMSSDVSILSDVSGLSLADAQHGSVDSDHGDEGLSEEELAEKKRKRKQFFVAREIMTSEQTFVDVLRLLNEDFRKVLHKSSEAIRAPVVPPATLNQILNHLPELQIFSEGLLQDLKQRIANWENDPRIADIFVKKGPFLKLYTSYIMEYDQKCAIFDEARKKYYEFDKCTAIFEASTRCYKLTLRHYMLKPVQRIPQYRLLLQDYQKYLTEDSPDYEDIQVALKIVTEVAEHANQSMKYGENLNKLLEIQNKLVGRYEIIKPGRYLVKEGLLNKVSRKEKQPRMFFLMNDVLLYTAPYTYNTYHLKNVLPLVGMKVRLADDTDEHEYKNEFSIISTQRSFTIAAESEEEKDAWICALKETIADNNEKRRTFVPDTKIGDPVVSSKGAKSEFKLGTRHPVWIPDDRVSMCMLCSAEFTLVFRRHHCRACGRVVCLFCSDYQAPLRYLHNKPSRVCKTCYSKLKKEIRTSAGSVSDVKEGEDSSLGLLALFSKSASNIKRSAHRQFHRVSNIRTSFGMGTKQKHKSKALTEVTATDKSAAVSGYLKRWVEKKWVKNWYMVKGNVLYMFKGSEDTAATESFVLLGYEVRPFAYAFQGVEAVLIFELIHKGMPSLMFRTENEASRDKWMKAIRTATVPL